MTYVMSDLHGQYEKYIKMLELINLRDSDDLFILGDVVDRGPEPVKILQDMSMRNNVFPIMGNHDYTALHVLSKLSEEVTDDSIHSVLTEDFMEILGMWQSDGGSTTMRAFRKLDPEDRAFMLDYVADFAPYEEITVNGNRFVLVHGGIDSFSPEKSMEEYCMEELITARTDYSKMYFPDRYLVTGHTPTMLIDPAYEGRIYRKNNHIAIDCGAGFGGALGCIRLDDFEEFRIG